MTFHRVYRKPKEVAPFDSCPAVSVDFFRECLRYFKSRFQVVSLADLVDHTAPAPRPKLAVTFDDGWLDNYEVAFEVLQEFGLPATIFMTAGKLGSDQPFWQQRLGRFFQAAEDAPNGRLARVAARNARKARGRAIYHGQVY